MTDPSSHPTRRVVLAALGLTAVAAASASAGSLWSPGPPVRRRVAREVARLVPVTPTEDGAGVKLRRVLGSRALRELDPFLLLDEFRTDEASDYLKGFPDHPHRGFETVTIMIDGAMEHKDSVGNHGLLGPGSVQWMTAGRGLVHSEMPRQQQGRMRGYQLWVNLPARLKMTAPRYQDLAASEVPTVDVGDARARVLAGTVDAWTGRVTGPVEDIVVAPTVLDLTVPRGGRVDHDLPGGHTVMLHVADGELGVGDKGTRVPAGHLVVFGPGERVTLTGSGRGLLVAGAPIGEPIVRHGPFVMNTQAEIEQAWADYRSGRLVEG